MLIEQTTQRDFITETADYVLDLFNRHQDARLVYHNYQQTVEVIRFINTIAEADRLSPVSVETAIIAAWFSNTGYLFEYANANRKAIKLAENFLDSKDYSSDRRKKVLDCLGHDLSQPARTGEQQLLSDALFAYLTTTDFGQKSTLLRLEMELMQNRKFTAAEWTDFQMQLLLETRFYLPHAKLNFESVVAQNMLLQKEKLEKVLQKKEEEVDIQMRNFQNIERKVPLRAIQTYFRTNYRNHINLSAIADNKANIMISVNSILISVLITLLSYRNIAETNPKVLMPVIIFLVSGLASLIFAVLSARPKVTMLNKKTMPMEDIKRNIVFFGNFVTLELEKYEEAVDAMFRDSELLYGNMTRDLYFLGKVLDKKYRYLTISYNVFMVGFIATVGSFLFVLFS